MTRFLRDETGAVTVDLVVMTAGLVGLALAIAATLAGGLRHQGEDMAMGLSSIAAEDAFAAPSPTGSTDIAPGDWTGGTLEAIDGFGTILALSGTSGEASLSLALSQTTRYAVVEFDMILGDSWDGESLGITLDGERMVTGTHSWRQGDPTLTPVDGADAALILVEESLGTGNDRWDAEADYVYTVRIVTPNDGDLDLSVATDLDQAAWDEFLGITAVTVVETDRP